jgi:hypothetical protein
MERKFSTTTPRLILKLRQHFQLLDQYSQKQTSPELPELLKLSSKYASMSIFSTFGLPK